MMDLSVKGLNEELQFAKNRWSQILEGWEEDIASLTGPAYKRKGGKKGPNLPENHAFEWFSLMLLDLTMGDPRVRITTDRPGDAQNQALALSYGVNAWSRQTKSRRLFEKLAMDFGLRFAVALVTSTPKPGYEEYEDPPYWPAISRVDPNHFLSDAAGTSHETATWSGHLVIDTIDSLKKQAKDPDSGWNLKELEKIELSQLAVGKFRPKGVTIPDRKEVPYWEIHVPGEQLDESPGHKKGYHGTIYTIVDGQADKVGWVRKPRPYFGPRSGPYVVGGCYTVPNEVAPLSSLVATKNQEVYLNRISASIRANVEAYKRLLFVTSGNQTLGQTIKNGKDLFVHALTDANIRDAVVSMELGGITQNHLAAKQDARDTLNRVSGITDAMAGQVTGEATATENALAGSAATKRVQFIAHKFKSFIADCMKNVAYFIDRDSDVVMDLGPEANGKIMGPDGQPLDGPITLRGSTKSDQSRSDFELMAFRIVTGSVERDLEQDMERRMAIIDQTIALLQNAAAMPYVEWSKYLDIKAELTGVEELRYLIDPRILMVVAASSLGQGGKPAQPTGAAGQPRSKSIVYGPMSSNGQSSQQIQQRMGATQSAAKNGVAQGAKSRIGGGHGY